MLTEFKKFILRGNVVDLAVGVVIGAAFTSVVNAFVADFLTPLIAAFKGTGQFADYVFTINGVDFKYGHFLNQLISFLLTAAVVFFFVVRPLNHLADLAKRGKPTADPATRNCPFCFTEISKKATRCPFCTSKVEPVVSSKPKSDTKKKA